MKVYIISVDWASGGECESIYGSGVREVYSDKEKALEALNQIVEEEYKNNDKLKTYDVERTATEFTAGERGSFNDEHFCVCVSEREVL